MTVPLDVARLREQTVGCTNVTHLNNAGSALPPAVVTDTVVDHLRLEEAIGGYEAHAQADARIEAVSASVATLIGSRPEQVALVESATEGWSRGFQAIAFTRGFSSEDRILVSSAEYASNVLPLLQVAAQSGASVEFIPDDDNGCVDVDALTNLLDDQVALVAITHCPSQNGLINDVEAIGAVLRDADAWYLVDACQSAGQVPLDIAAIGADFLSATGRKFLRGPRGTGFLYASDRALTELEPFPLDLHSATWLSHGYAISSGARRFEYWERSYAALLGMGAAIDYALDLGIDAIAVRIGELANHARTTLAAIDGVTVRDRGVQRSGIVTFTHASVDAEDLVPAIRARGINVSLSTADYARVDFDKHGIHSQVRVSPHVYNTTEEIDRLVGVVADTVRRLQH
ncbi:MAG: aminotransferase class V-fold PLP-dependent enzyme [Actinomycetes bacterium]